MKSRYRKAKEAYFALWPSGFNVLARMDTNSPLVRMIIQSYCDENDFWTYAKLQFDKKNRKAHLKDAIHPLRTAYLLTICDSLIALGQHKSVWHMPVKRVPNEPTIPVPQSQKCLLRAVGDQRSG